ncbi:MAG: 50S ribosome-binding GTPase [Candidatus Heimdallarchaeota archaeon]|nr:50S ribosome-binding GTPase [Candidatus Heimdallarchaeota archaeon]
MRELAEAAGFKVLAELSFRKINKVNYLPELRMQEMDYLIETHKINHIIINEPLSIKYIRKFEEHFDNDDIVVIDKPMLILEIFEKKASSADIQLQINMAKLKYTQPRMRQELGVSLRTEKQARDRGAGETATEIMKSDMRGRISTMQSRLDELLELKRSTILSTTVPKIPILGHYSVGKTTLFNILTENKRETGSEAFTTLLLKSSWSRITGYPVEFVDTIGLVDLPPQVLDAFQLMLEEVFASHVLALCLDASTEEHQFDGQLASLLKYYEKFASETVKYKVLFILTKCDLIDQSQYYKLSAKIDSEVEDKPYISEYEIIGVRADKLELTQNAVARILDSLLDDSLISVKYKGLTPSELSMLYTHAKVSDEVWKGGVVDVSVRLPITAFQQYLHTIRDKIAEQEMKDVDQELPN